MIFVLRRPRSTSALVLAEALGGERVREVPQLTKDDIVVCWGSQLTDAPCRVLNGSAPLRSKLTDAKMLRGAGVPTVNVSENAKKGWLARTAFHTGGADLLKPPRDPDFWVEKLDLRREFRVHSFTGRSIRAGVKVARDGFENPHEWIRSWDAGWRISYIGQAVKQKHRDIAHGACKALGLDFGAVDIGEREDGTLVVLEVNRAPGIEGTSVDAYRKAVQRWIEE